MRSTESLDVLDRLLALARLQPDEARDVLDMELFHNPGLDSAAFEYWFGAGPLGDAELRVPREGTRDGMLILKLHDELQLSGQEVTARYGEPALEVPEPSDAPTNPVYYRYRHAGGELSFALNQDDDRVASIVVDRIDAGRGSG